MLLWLINLQKNASILQTVLNIKWLKSEKLVFITFLSLIMTKNVYSYLCFYAKVMIETHLH